MGVVAVVLLVLAALLAVGSLAGARLDGASDGPGTK